MHRQVGSELVIGDDGLVTRGLIIRHLILPNDVAGSRATLAFIAKELGTRVTLSVMAQYYPTTKITDENALRNSALMLLNRGIREREYHAVLALLDEFGFENGWVQEFEAERYYRPDFTDRAEPFKDRLDFHPVAITISGDL